MDVNVRSLVRLIKNYRAIVFCSIIASVVIVFYISQGTAIALYPVLQYGILAVCLCIFYFCFSSYRKSRLKKIDSILYDNCDPEAYLDIYGEFISRLEDADINTDIGAYDLRLGFEMYWLRLCEGIIASGEYGEAFEILNDLASITPQKQADVFKALLHQKLCSVNLRLGDIEKANEHLNKLKKAIEGLRPKKRAAFGLRSNELQCRIGMAEGRTHGAENVFEESFKNTDNEYERAAAKYYFGQLYLHNGDTERAKAAFEYVTQHGNKLHIAEEAKQQLSGLL